MAWDWTKWLTDEWLEDHTEEPVEGMFKNISKKFDIKLTLQAFKKRRTDDTKTG